MKKFLFVITLCFFAINTQGQSYLEKIENTYQSAPNTASLAKYLNKSKKNLTKINKSIKSLRRVVIGSNSRSLKKRYSLAIKNNTEYLLNNSLLADKYALRITNSLNLDSSQTQKMEYIREKLYSIKIEAKSLIRTCNFVINKPRKLTRYKYNSMSSLNKYLHEAYSELSSRINVLLYVAATESIERNSN